MHSFLRDEKDWVCVTTLEWIVALAIKNWENTNHIQPIGFLHPHPKDTSRLKVKTGIIWFDHCLCLMVLKSTQFCKLPNYGVIFYDLCTTSHSHFGELLMDGQLKITSNIQFMKHNTKGTIVLVSPSILTFEIWPIS